MARPIKAPGEKRDQRFNLRYTAAEIEHLRMQAANAGLHPHEYARRRTLGHAVPPAPARSSDPALVSELNRIGVNLNQLARAVNADRRVQGDPAVVLAKLDAALDEVLSRYGS